jgi:type IV secretory pathway VirB2 component (pilin)
MRIAQQPIQLSGFYLAGLLCLATALLKLTLEGHWSWWRVLLPLWAVLGHNILSIGVGFAWLLFVSPGPPGEEDLRIREDSPQRYEFAAMLCFLLFAHNLLARIEQADQRMWGWLGTGPWHAFVSEMHAGNAGNLPWKRPMTAIATSLTGPVAYAIGLIGIAIAGGAMLWGGELTEFGRRACMIGLVVSVLVFAAPMLASAFGVNAAVV